MSDFALPVRAVRCGNFTASVGTPRYLEAPDGEEPDPTHVLSETKWVSRVVDAGSWENDKGEARGDILFFIHGYNLSETALMVRPRTAER